MKKRIFCLLTALLLCFSLCLPTFAAEQSYVFTDSPFFSEEEIAELDDLAAQIAMAHNFHVSFLLISDASEYNYDSLYDLMSDLYAEQYGNADGIMLGCDDNYWNAYCSGSANRLFSEEDIEELWNAYDVAETYVGGVKNYLAKVEPYLSGKLVVSPILGAESTIKCDSRLNDMAGLLTDAQKTALLSVLNETSQRLNFDLVVVTANSLGGKYYVDYADDYFDYNGFGLGSSHDGALLLISMEPGNRKCYISTSGKGISEFSDSKIESMLDVIVDDHLVDGEYYEAMTSFVSLCDRQLTPPTLAELLPIWVGVSALIALIVAGIRILVLKSKMKSVRSQAAANSYIDGDLNVTRASDIFLYHTVTRTKKESSSSSGGSSSHRSSSGSSHGGGGRSF